MGLSLFRSVISTTCAAGSHLVLGKLELGEGGRIRLQSREAIYESSSILLTPSTDCLVYLSSMPRAVFLVVTSLSNLLFGPPMLPIPRTTSST